MRVPDRSGKPGHGDDLAGAVVIVPFIIPKKIHQIESRALQEQLEFEAKRVACVDRYDLPAHQLIRQVILLEHNLTDCTADYASLAPLLGIERRGRDDEAVARNFIAGAADLLRSIGIPERIKVERDQTTKEFALEVAENAKYSTPKSVDNTPAALSIEDMAEIYLDVVES